MNRLLLPHEVDELFRYPAGRSKRLALKGSLSHIKLPDGDVRFDEAEIYAILGRDLPRGKAIQIRNLSAFSKLTGVGPGVLKRAAESGLCDGCFFEVRSGKVWWYFELATARASLKRLWYLSARASSGSPEFWSGELKDEGPSPQSADSANVPAEIEHPPRPHGAPQSTNLKGGLE